MSSLKFPAQYKFSKCPKMSAVKCQKSKVGSQMSSQASYQWHLTFRWHLIVNSSVKKVPCLVLLVTIPISYKNDYLIFMYLVKLQRSVSWLVQLHTSTRPNLQATRKHFHPNGWPACASGAAWRGLTKVGGCQIFSRFFLKLNYVCRWFITSSVNGFHVNCQNRVISILFSKSLSVYIQWGV